MLKAERHAHIIRRAYELASEGENNYVWIEHLLEREGFQEARNVLDSRSIRDEIERLAKEFAKKVSAEKPNPAT